MSQLDYDVADQQNAGALLATTFINGKCFRFAVVFIAVELVLTIALFQCGSLLPVWFAAMYYMPRL